MKRIVVFILAFLSLIFLIAVPVDAHIVIKIGSDMNVEEDQKVDNAVAVGGQITVSGLVENNVVTLGGSIVLTSTAVVRGNVLCIGGVVVQGNGAQIYGNVTELNLSNILAALSSIFYGDTDTWSWLADIIYFCFFTMLFTLALLMVALFPRPLNAVCASIEENKTMSCLGGALGTLMIAPFFMLLIFSFVGIPLIPLFFSIILLAFMFGFIMTKTFRHNKQSLIRETLLGFVLWWFIGWIPFYIGMAVKAVVVTAGFGGVLLAVFSRGNHWRHNPEKRSPAAGNDD
jgi:hypothetical protein